MFGARDRQGGGSEENGTLTKVEHKSYHGIDPVTTRLGFATLFGRGRMGMLSGVATYLRAADVRSERHGAPSS